MDETTAAPLLSAKFRMAPQGQIVIARDETIANVANKNGMYRFIMLQYPQMPTIITEPHWNRIRFAFDM